MALRVFSYFPTTVDIDGEIAPIRIKRLEPLEMLEFRRELKRTGQPAAPAPADETSEQTALREQLELALAKAALAFNRQAITDYITVEPGHIVWGEGGDEVPVDTGAALFRLYGAREEIVRQLLFAIAIENEFSPAQKAGLRAALAPATETVAA